MPHRSCLSAIIVGAGPVGLASAYTLALRGFSVVVIERRKSLSLQGGDIQVSPNGHKAVRSLGLDSILSSVASPHQNFVARRAESHEAIYSLPMDIVGSTPSLMFRRADLAETLYKGAVEVGVKFFFDKTVKTLHEANASVVLDSGEEMSADFIIGADGVTSSIRTKVFPDRDTSATELDAVCFQWCTPRDVMESSPDTRALWEEGQNTMGVICGDTNYISYWSNVSTNSFFVVLSQRFYKKRVDVGSWTRPGDMDEVKSLFAKYSAPFKTVLENTTACELWRVADSATGVPWTSPSGRVVMIGDAIHTMPPDAAQGLSQGLEDVASLAIFLEQASSASDIPALLHEFGKLRQHRVDRVIAAARNNLALFGMSPGPERDARDATWKTFNARDAIAELYTQADANPNADYHDLGFVKWVQTYDAAAAAREHVEKLAKDA